MESIQTYQHDFIDVPHKQEKFSIFIVEDDLKMLKFLIDKLGSIHNVYFAFNGAEALYRLPQLPSIPQLIISDVKMYEMDGFEFAQELSKQSNYNHIPIIFLSAKSTLEDRVSGLKLGAIDFITKPFSIDELISKIEAVLDNTELQRKAIMNLTLSGLTNMKPSNSLSQSVFYENCKTFKLTPKELEIALSIRDGINSNKELATKLNITERTITTHISNIYQKVGVSTRIGLLKKLDR